VLLAWRDRAKLSRFLKAWSTNAAPSGTTTEELLAVLDVREQGYGEDNEEQEEGCAASAYRFSTVSAWSSRLSISFPTLRFSEERLHEYVAMLHTAARKISEQMGYNDYPF
jgi:IclR family KDG regulon transcriptional repressor